MATQRDSGFFGAVHCSELFRVVDADGSVFKNNADRRIRALCAAMRIGGLSLCAEPFAASRANERHKRSVYERGRHGLAKIERMDDLDAVFGARMRALAHRGGAATKKLVADDPAYYRRIGQLGGEASVAACKRRIYAEIEGRICEPVSVPPRPPLAQPTPSPPRTKPRPLTLGDIIGEEELLSRAFGPASSRSSRR